MKDIYLFLIFIPLAYLIGSVNFATIISSIKNKNIRALGSGNPGTMNMLRSVGKFWGCLTFILDFFKGVAFALIGKFVFNQYNALAMYVLGFAVVLGHIFSCFLKFKGGKGVATSLGVFAVCEPITFAVSFVAMLLFLYFAKTGFLGSLLAITLCATTLFVLNCIFRPLYFYVILVLLVIWTALIYFTHKDNFKRLKEKRENSLSLFKKDDTNTNQTNNQSDTDCDITNSDKEV